MSCCANTCEQKRDCFCQILHIINIHVKFSIINIHWGIVTENFLPRLHQDKRPPLVLLNPDTACLWNCKHCSSLNFLLPSSWNLCWAKALQAAAWCSSTFLPGFPTESISCFIFSNTGESHRCQRVCSSVSSVFVEIRVFLGLHTIKVSESIVYMVCFFWYCFGPTYTKWWYK